MVGWLKPIVSVPRLVQVPEGSQGGLLDVPVSAESRTDGAEVGSGGENMLDVGTAVASVSPVDGIVTLVPPTVAVIVRPLGWVTVFVAPAPVPPVQAVVLTWYASAGFARPSTASALTTSSATTRTVRRAALPPTEDLDICCSEEWSPRCGHWMELVATESSEQWAVETRPRDVPGAGR